MANGKRLIDANALLEKLKKTSRYFDIKFDIEEAPTVYAAPVVHGRWVTDEDGHPYCSECTEYCQYDRFGDFKLTDYCHSCGAKMDGGNGHAEW